MNNSNKIIFTSQNTERLDKAISLECTDITRAKAQILIKSSMVTVNDKSAAKSLTLKIGDIVEIEMPEPENLDVVAENIPLDILYEDNDIIIVNKAKGMVVHPAPGHYTGTMVNALMYHAKDSLSGINGVIRPGIVHRIDKDTSGILIVAKNDLSHNFLADQIKVHSFKREYRAVVYGNVKSDTGTISAPIGRNPKDRKQMAILYNDPSAREATTHYEVIERYNGYTFLKLTLETGRTHQIRVHMASLGHPVAGDAVYGPKKVIKYLQGQCLHAGVIGFIHPTTKEYMEFTSELPEYFKDFINKIK